MVYASPTLLVQATKDLIQATQAWIDLAAADGDIHYPTCSASNDTPMALIMPQEGQSWRKVMDGVKGIPSGTVQILFLFSDTYSVGGVETFAETFCQEVPAGNTGLLVNDASYEIAGEAPPELSASGNDLLSVVVTLTYGLEA